MDSPRHRTLDCGAIPLPSPSDVPPKPAGLPRRLAAMCYDALLLLAILLVFTFSVWALRGGREVAPGTLWFQAALVLVTLGFYVGFWTHGGQTLGMRAWKIRVEGAHGEALTWSKAVARFGLAWVSVLPLGLGFWWSLADPERRCWHDRLSRTRVVRVDARLRPLTDASRDK